MNGTARSEFPGWRLDAVVGDTVDVPTLATVDVVVVGGGASGVAAATVAAEQGLSVILVERYGFCGGAAVAGMSGTICGLYLAEDTPTRAEQIVFGFTERFRRTLHERGGLTPPQLYGKTWADAHDPLVWREAADQLLERAGVRVLFHTRVVGVLLDGDVHTGVVVESNAGRSVIRAARTIDASGDAAVVARAGHGTVFGANGSIQNPTMFFRLGDVDQAVFDDYYGSDTICPPKVTEAILKAREDGLDLPRHHIWIFRTNHDGQLLVNATRLTAPDGRMLNVIDPEDFTLAEVGGRRQVRDYARFLAENVPGCEKSYVLDTGVEAGIRQTRSILGVQTLTDDDVVAAANALTASPAPRGRSSCTAASGPSCTGSSTTTTRSPIWRWSRARARTSSLPAGACPPSTRRWPRPASPPSASSTARRPRWPPSGRCATASPTATSPAPTSAPR